MPKSNLTPEQEHWAGEVYKHFRWQLPDQPRSDEEAAADLTAKEEYKKLAQRLKKLDEGSRAVMAKEDCLFAEDDKEAFEEFAEQLYKTLLKAKKLRASLKQEEAPDNTELKSLLPEIEQLMKEMEKVVQKSFAEADDLINKTLYGQITAFQKTVAQAEAWRSILVKWGVDLSKFDKAYESANDALTKMITAVNGHDYNGLKELLEKAPKIAEALETAYQNVADQPAQIKAEAAEQLDLNLKEALALNDRQAAFEDAPDLLGRFEDLFQQLVQAEQKTKDALKAENGGAVSKQLSLGKNLVHDLKQIWLKAHARRQVSGDGVSEESLQQIEELRGKLDLAEQELPSIKVACADSALYADTLAHSRGLLRQAQDSLISENLQEADEKLQALSLDLGKFDQFIAQRQENKRKVAERLERLTKDAEPWFARLQDCEKLWDFGKEAAQYYRAFDREIIILNNNTELAAKHIDEGNILLAQEAVETGDSNLKMLIGRAEAALQHLKDMESSQAL